MGRNPDKMNIKLASFWFMEGRWARLPRVDLGEGTRKSIPLITLGHLFGLHVRHMCSELIKREGDSKALVS